MLPSHTPPSHTLPLDHLDVLSCMTMATLPSASLVPRPFYKTIPRGTRLTFTRLWPGCSTFTRLQPDWLKWSEDIDWISMV